MSDPDRYTEFRQKLEEDDLRNDSLNDIKNILSSSPNDEAKNVIRSVGLGNILDCLKVTDPKQVDLTCEVLQLCFANLSFGDVVRDFTSNIMYLLRHENNSVRKLAVEEIYKTIKTDPKLLPLPDYIDVLLVVAQLVGEKDLGIATKAILITSSVDIASYPQILQEMKVILDDDKSSKCNAFEVIANVSSKSAEYLELCGKEGYIEYMLSELLKKDVLYQLNILELLSKISVTPHGIKYLVEKDILKRITEFVVSEQNDPYSSMMLIPGYMKFFGAIAHLYPKEIIDNHPIIVDCILWTFTSGFHSMLSVAFDTVGLIGSTIEGKLSLVSLGARYTSVVKRVADTIKLGITEMRVSALFCMASLVGYEKDPKLPKSGPIDHRVTLMTREWFRCISDQPTSMEVLLKLCKNPFLDMKLAAFSLLDAVCQHQWGEEMVAKTAGFAEFLLDRSVNHTKEAKEAKFDIIKRLSKSPAFDPTTTMKFTLYLQQGPFFADSVMEVAMDEE